MLINDTCYHFTLNVPHRLLCYTLCPYLVMILWDVLEAWRAGTQLEAAGHCYGLNVSAKARVLEMWASVSVLMLRVEIFGREVIGLRLYSHE